MGEALMHVVCPECEQPIELPAQGAGEKITCPTCGKEFEARGTILLPKAAERTEFQEKLASEPPPKIESPWDDKKITEWNGPSKTDLTLRAERLQKARNVCFWLAGAALLLGVIQSAQIYETTPFWPFAVVAGSLASLGMWFGMVAHLVHIRAALERLARKH